MNIDGIGDFELNMAYGWHYGPSFNIPAFSNHAFKFVIDDYENDDKDKYSAAMKAIIKIDTETISQSNKHIFSYYRDTRDSIGEDEGFPIIQSQKDVWEFIHFGDEMYFCKRDYDKKIYVSIECNCDWEQEHGLQIVIKEGKIVTKIGQYDGHLSNADSYDDDSLENIVYILLEVKTTNIS